jgi:hypothetical protein
MSVQTHVIEPEAVAAPDHDEIAERAYEIHVSGDGGDELDNWLRAERELMEARGYSVADTGAETVDA